MKTEIIIFIIWFILLSILLAFIAIFSNRIFKKKQPSKVDALFSPASEGYGFYSDPQSLGCQSSDGKCNSAGTETFIFKCIPNPHTQKGCIDEEGNMTYNHKYETRSCQSQCIGSLFTIQTGASVSGTLLNNESNNLLNNVGCNKVVNIKTGIDNTDFFLGDFDFDKSAYELKNCVPNNFVSYYQKKYTCNTFDNLGDNNCRYTCGQDNALRSNGLFDSKLSKNVLMYYPIEFDEEGVKRHVCYDINDVNQVEILNSTKQVPPDFVYPNFCYKHVNKNNNLNLINYYPQGTSNIITNNLFLNSDSQLIIVTDNQINDLKNSGIDLVNYNFNYNYNEVIKVQVNQETMLVRNIDNQKFNYQINNTNNDIVVYLNTKGVDYHSNLDNISLDNVNLVNYAYNGVNFDTNTNYLPFRLNDILESNINGPAEVILTGASTQISNPNNELVVGDYIYSRGVNTNYITGQLSKITSVDTGTCLATVSSFLVNEQEPIVWQKLKGNDGDNISFNITQKGNPTSTLVTTPVSDLIITNNIFFSEADLENNNRDGNYQMVRSEDSMLNIITYNLTQALFLFSGKGLHYPLYLVNYKNYTNVEATTLKGTKYYLVDLKNAGLPYQTDNIKRLDITDIEDKDFYVSFIDSSNGNTVYYYPVQLNNQNYSQTITNLPDYPELTFYTNNSKVQMEPPDDYLGYYNFNLYNGYDMTYNRSYPCFLSKSAITNGNVRSYPEYPNLQFFAPSTTLDNFDTPPNQSELLIDFYNIYNIGAVSVNYVQGIPINAQLAQNNYLPYFNTSNNNPVLLLDSNNDIRGKLQFDGQENKNDIYSMRVIRQGDNLFNNIQGESKFVTKCKLYNQIIKDQIRSSSDNNTLIFAPEKEILIEADFTVFRTPFIQKPDGSIDNLCFDQYNRPLTNKKDIVIPSTSEQALVVNIACKKVNTVTDPECGVYADASTLFPCIQERNGDNLRFANNLEVFNVDNNYMNAENYMESGLSVTNELVCIKDFNVKDEEVKCFPNYFTQIESDRTYGQEEELFVNKYKRDFYISLINDNNSSPLNTLNWQRIFVNTPDSVVASYQTFLYKSVVPEIFQVNIGGKSGVAPIDIGVQPIYRKLKTPYYDVGIYSTSGTYNVNNSFPWKKANSISRGLNAVTSNISQFKFIDASIKVLPVTVPTNTSSTDLVKLSTNFTITDDTIIDFDIRKGDIFQPSFSLFNAYLIAVFNIYNFTFSNNNLSYFTEKFRPLSNNIIEVTNKNVLFKDTYYAVLPVTQAGSPQLNSTQIPLLVDDDSNIIYNLNFEIILIKEIDINSNNITVERNALSVQDNNLLTNNVNGSASTYVLLPFNDRLIDNNFPIIAQSDNSITFTYDISIPVNILEADPNYQDNITTTFGDSLIATPYLSGNFIKKNIVTPNDNYQNYNLYLAEKPNNNVISALLGYTVVDGNYYIDEIREKRYTENDDFELTFQTTDTIKIGNTVLYVFGTNIVYQDKRFDYQCSYVSGDKNLSTNTSLYKPAASSGTYKDFLAIPYVKRGPDGSSNILSEFHIIQSPLPSRPDKVNWKVESGVRIEDFTFFPYQTYQGSDVNFKDVIQYQEMVESGNKLSYITLEESVFTSERGTININNIKVNGKPYGISYIDRNNVQGELNRSGKGCITSFTIKSASINGNIAEGDIFVNKSNYVLRATSGSVASYQFFAGEFNSSNNIKPYQEDNTYITNDIIEYINPNQRIYYRNQTGSIAKFDAQKWTSYPDSIYTVDPVIDFRTGESYLQNDLVFYQDQLWKASKSNFNQVPTMDSSFWQIQNNNADYLSNSDNKFYTFTTISDNITSEDILVFKNRNVNDYPLSIHNILKEKNYCPTNFIKFDTSETGPNFDNSFVATMPGVSNLASIMAQAFLSNKEDNYLSLPAVPYNENNYHKAKYLRDCGDNASVNNLAQYIYEIPIENALDEGKPFCVGDYSDTGVSTVKFANSIIFFMLPIDLADQDYNSYGVSYNQDILTSDYYSYNYSANKTFNVITSDNKYGQVTTGATTAILKNVNNSAVGDTHTLTNGIQTFTAEVTKVGQYPFVNDTLITNSGQNYANGDIWYYVNGKQETIAHGIIDNTSGSLGLSNFIAYNVDYNQIYNNSNGLSIISEQGTDFQYNFQHQNSNVILDFNINNTLSLTAGEYLDSKSGLSISIALDSSGNPLPYGQELVTSTNPSNLLSDGTSIYHIAKDNQLKVRMFGLFGNDYLARVSYQLESEIINNDNQTLPGLIFDIYGNELYNNEDSFKLVGEGLSQAAQIDNFYNVFTLVTEDGASANIKLLNNYYDRPVKYNNANLITKQALQGFNIVTGTDLHQFPGVSYGGFQPIYMGNVNQVLPVIEADATNQLIIFNTIRQNRSKAVANNQYDCNFYFTPQNVDIAFPSGGTYYFRQVNGAYKYRFNDEAEQPIGNLTLKSNNQYTFDVSDSSLDNGILVFSKLSGNDFISNIIKDENTTISSNNLNIKYFINGLELSYDDYSSTNYYNNYGNGKERIINFYYDTELTKLASNVNIYLGVTKDIAKIAFTNN